MKESVRDVLTFPGVYGVPDNDTSLLAWSQVDQRITDALRYWMATARRTDARMWCGGGAFGEANLCVTTGRPKLVTSGISRQTRTARCT